MAADLDPRLSQVAMDDYRQADFEPRIRALLDYAVLVTENVHAAGAREVAELRAVGWNDEDLLEAVEIIGFFNYYNRMVDALGVEPEPNWE